MSWRAAALLTLLAIACREQPKQQVRQQAKAELALLTSLPLAFAEGFSLDVPPHPVLRRLEEEFTMRLVDGPEQLPERGLLLAIQPRALTAERLVALDKWVRRGGRVLLLADPRLTWQSSRPLGDKLRPPVSFPDTGLLAHWGLRLDPPGENGPVIRRLGGREVLTGSPGALTALPGGRCAFSPDQLVARCSVGQGRAVVVADADLVQAGVPGGLDGPTAGNPDALAAELDALRN